MILFVYIDAFLFVLDRLTQPVVETAEKREPVSPDSRSMVLVFYIRLNV